MGWYLHMTPEEMEAEFGGGGAAANTCSLSAASSCSIDNKPTTTPEGSTADTTPTDANKSKEETDVVASTTTTTTSSGNTACLLPNDASPPPPPPDVDYIYHLCRKANWDEAKSKKLPYFPPTFMADGKFTRASVELDDIVDVANEYYKSSDGDWIVLELDCKVLYYVLGIPTLAQRAPESTKDQPVKCLQIFGGISTLNDDLVSNIFPVKRSSKDGTFLKVLEPISFDSSNNQEQEQKQSKLKDVSNASTTTTTSVASSSDPSKTKKTIKKTTNVGREQPLDEKAASSSASSKQEQTSNKRKGFLGRLRGGKNQ